ncbi:MAG: hypothetical protein GF411_15060 [Candidatus Lokiarchaeota archaeon]|nr:hypothetical protein [Candidatus Lokiarchaeota archaeon]
MVSTNWTIFIQTFFEDPYMMWREGIDPTIAGKLLEEERKQAEKMLIDSMVEGDPFAVMGLREMHSEQAIPIMKDLLRKSHPLVRIEIAIALNRMENTSKYTSHIIDVLQNGGHWSIRMTAARKIREFRSKMVVGALFNSMFDPEYLVRIHSAESLLYIHGLKPDIQNYPKIAEKIHTKSGCNNEARFKESIRLLKKLFETTEK